jgi:predicted Fe-S protein YdhL (DUF1289 family)
MSSAATSTPCVKVCVLDPILALCIGCGRTLAEISAWSGMSESERRAVMAGLSERIRLARPLAAGDASLESGRAR